MATSLQALRDRIPDGFLQGAVATAGVILLSQGFSFARIEGTDELRRHINDHATLIAGAGIGLLAGSMLLDRLLRRIHTLEAHNRELAAFRAAKAEPASPSAS